MESIWRQDVRRIRFAALKGTKKTDVLIVGGGIAGILCTYALTKAGVDCVLVEATQICGGTSGNTTAKITLGHGLLYDGLIHRFGEEKAAHYLQAQMRACEEYERLCRGMDCDYEKRDSYVFSLDDERKIKKEVAALNRLGVSAAFSNAPALPFPVAGAVCVKDQAQFHPLKFLYALAKDLPIYERTKVLELKPKRAMTNHGEISFHKLVIATHFPIINKHGLYPLKLYQHRSYVLALKGATPVGGMYVDEADAGLSFRDDHDVLLLGGGAHRTGKRGGCWQELKEVAQRYYPEAAVVGRWAAQDCMTLDGVPYVGQYAPTLSDVYVVTGFNKWGMTNAMAAANILCDLVRGKENSGAAVFSPSRTMWRGQLALNVLESAAGFLTPTVPRCPHLGCALKYNREEHSWDCPCHGSRFTEHGELIDNPATDDKENMSSP